MVHWTLSVAHRRTGWLDESFHCAFRELMLHVAAREGFLCPAYCLMLDHLHLVWMALRADSDQVNGMAFLRTYLEARLGRFQHQSHDHVLREEERQRNAFARVCNYILQNAVRAELAKQPRDWTFSGAIVPGYPTLQLWQQDFWPKFWKLYATTKSPEAAKIIRPPLHQPQSKPNVAADVRRL